MVLVLLSLHFSVATPIALRSSACKRRARPLPLSHFLPLPWPLLMYLVVRAFTSRSSPNCMIPTFVSTFCTIATCTAMTHDAPPGLATIHNCLQRCNTRPFRSPFYRHGGIIRPFSTSLAAQETLILRGRLLLRATNLSLVHDAPRAHYNIREGLSATACPPTLSVRVLFLLLPATPPESDTCSASTLSSPTTTTSEGTTHPFPPRPPLDRRQ